MSEDLTPEGVAANKRETMLNIGEQEFRLWQHSPITAGFFQYLEDMVGLYRDRAADVVEAGSFDLAHLHQDTNPLVLRGQIAMLRQLHGVTVQIIQGFYGKETPDEDQAD